MSPVMTFLAPEATMAWAVGQCADARKLAKQLKDARLARLTEIRQQIAKSPCKQASEDRLSSYSVPTLGSTGLLYKFGEEIILTTAGNSWKMTEKMEPPESPWTNTHAFFALSRGFRYYDYDGKPWEALSATEVLRLVRRGKLIPPTRAEIKDRSKGDVVTKMVAIIQTLWFVMQCMARWSQNLPMTQLEVMTLAYTAITLVIYAFWWEKPLNVACPIRVPYIAPLEMTPTDRILARIFPSGDDSTSFRAVGALVPVVAAAVAFTIFGTIHCIAWLYSFPTSMERTLWRVSALAVLCIPLAVMMLPIFDRHQWIDFDNMTPFLTYMFMISLVLFSLSFSTLRALPVEAYRTVRWTEFLPHV
ncbi:hypothetical protein HWV62_17078 [Athelia sp. TMB]|nr:hypothetical protein HWV62_17078 [Athelia sp. TMB]